MLQIEIHSRDLEKEVNALIDAGLYADSQALIVLKNCHHQKGISP